MTDLEKHVNKPGRDKLVKQVRAKINELGVEPDFLKMNNGKAPPVIHVDSTAPLYSDKTKKLITDKIWGIYINQISKA